MYALTVPARADALPVIAAFVWAVSEEAHLTQQRAYRLRLAVDEIVTNILEHGYHSADHDGSLHLVAEVGAHQLTITIEDSGTPYDITQEAPVVDVNAPPDERDPGGLGVFLVVRYIDDIRYEYVNGHNVNQLTMHLE